MERITSLGNKDTRSGFGAGLHIAGKADERIVALCAALMGALATMYREAPGAWMPRLGEAGPVQLLNPSPPAGSPPSPAPRGATPAHEQGDDRW